jgi:[glutamine synthetase] adenylyltransferase / [glutamine synthetase]-adenylyl-L-tyrosine phosphorylase
LPRQYEQIEHVVQDLPDEEGAKLFFERLATEHPNSARRLGRDTGLFADLLTLAAWSPLLATTILQHPEYIPWLSRERKDTRVKTREDFLESLARFALTNSQLNHTLLLSRFRHRELLRIYLHDIHRRMTLVETTEELSNLADAILEYALTQARQQLDNLYGSPLCVDERGRTATASFCILGLGKLGSFELNYSSDIDLIFLYSDDGVTSGVGTRESITNKEYFIKLAREIVNMVGGATGEGAPYRVDLRLRPHGRDGALSSSIAEAVKYYQKSAQNWELQALIRSRASAGSAALYIKFADEIHTRIYRPDETVASALSYVKQAKQKIDHQHKETAGFNVKLGRGGIREIEFIAQALQLAYGSGDVWIQEPHTLRCLERLAERGLILESERTQLSNAYIFLRTLEHRLQMEHGLQTHTLPEDSERRTLIAGRMGFKGPDKLLFLKHELEFHTTNVHSIYERVFGDTTQIEIPETKNRVIKTEVKSEASSSTQPIPTSTQYEILDTDTNIIRSAASIFASILDDSIGSDKESINRLTLEIQKNIEHSLNRKRALLMLSQIVSSLDKSDARPILRSTLKEEHIYRLIKVCGASEPFSEMIASNPTLISALPIDNDKDLDVDYYKALHHAIEEQPTLRNELAALRTAWRPLILKIGTLDLTNIISIYEANEQQTKLAAASIDIACLIAHRELERRYGSLESELRYTVLGLGRMGGKGLDYGSDLDLVFIYDDKIPSPISSLTHAEVMSRFTETVVTALSSITRDGYLYRVDLRLRPYGKNGATATPAHTFITYLREYADVWEWLAYVKLRAVSGTPDMLEAVEKEARETIHKAAQRMQSKALSSEIYRVRKMLEEEKAGRASTFDIKFGEGGMLDVYFTVRYLQLRDNVPDQGEDRSTIGTLKRLFDADSLSLESFEVLTNGYRLLRTVDHYLRLVAGRSTRLPAIDHPLFQDIAQCTSYSSAQLLYDDLSNHMAQIHSTYKGIVGS